MVPGSSSASWPVLRPFSGSDCTVSPEMTSPTVVVSVCRIGVLPVDLDRLLDGADRHPEVEPDHLPGFEHDRRAVVAVRKPVSSALTS